MNKNKTSLIALVGIGVLTLMLQSCAATRTDNSSYDASKDALKDALTEDFQYTVKKGDQLGSISISVTGDISHWKDIAAYNEITDPRTLRTGTLLLIPAGSYTSRAKSCCRPRPTRTRLTQTSIYCRSQRFVHSRQQSCNQCTRSCTGQHNSG